MLRLGNMGLTGTVPSCLFNGNSSLYQVGVQGCIAGCASKALQRMCRITQ